MTSFGGANITMSNLNRADLSATDLSETNFSMSDLGGADFIGANLFKANFSGANLRGARLRANLDNTDFSGADLREVDFVGSNIREAKFIGANLSHINLIEVDLSGADLSRANLNGANLSGSNLREANLKGANLNSSNLSCSNLVETNLLGSNLTDSNVYGISVWNTQTDESTKQNNLVITKLEEPTITIDNLKVAQFIYLLLNNQEIREVINTITSKVVLILGRFKEERKLVLDALREELRRHDYLPIIFDFNESANRDVKETVSILAHLSKFIIADLTDPSSIPLELQTIIPELPSVPVVPLIQENFDEFSMFKSFKRYPWVLDTFIYINCKELIDKIQEKIISPVEEKLKGMALK